MAFSKLQLLIRAVRPRSLAEIVSATRNAILQITLADLDGYFNHCGYVST